MKSIKSLLLFSIIGLIWQCTPKATENKAPEAVQEVNPAADGFDGENSDAAAIAIADEVMAAMGGRNNWDGTRYLAWNFFGRRHLLWDKKSGNVRITTDDATYLINVFDDSGKVMKGGEELTHPDSVGKYVDRAKKIWINDSYWLVMPFKLKDSGVTLNSLGKDTTATGDTADKLQLKFKEVGVTPNNMYWVYVDETSRLVTQWDFFTNADDEKPRFSNPWQDYKQHGDILLSGDRGRGKLTDIAVYQTLPDSVFTTFAPIDYKQF